MSRFDSSRLSVDIKFILPSKIFNWLLKTYIYFRTKTLVNLKTIWPGRCFNCGATAQLSIDQSSRTNKRWCKLMKGESVSLKVNLKLVLSATICLGLVVCNSTGFAQVLEGPIGDAGQVPVQQADPSERGGNVSGVGEGVGDLGQTVQLDPFNVEPIDDLRNQGFVGVTASRIQDKGFIGRPGELIAPPLAEGAFEAGTGVNESSNPVVSIGGGNIGGQGAGFSPAQEGVVITRRGMRSRVQASFYAPQIPAQQITSRFANRISLQPGPQTPTRNYTINVQNRTAVLNGSVNTRAESERLERQLRLEPGVYKIVNKLQILN